MSTKKILKRISLVAVSALGFGLMSVMPAKAATTIAAGAVLIDGSAAATETGTVGTVIDKTFSLTTSDSEDTDTVVYSVAMTTSPNAAGEITPEDSSDDTAATAENVLRLNAFGLDAVTGWTLDNDSDDGTLNATLRDTHDADAEGAAELDAESNRGTISFYPTHTGTYVITLTASPTEGTDRTATLTITVAATAISTTGDVNSISLAAVTAVPKVGSAVAINFLANVDSVTNQAYDEYLPFTGYLSTYPSAGFAQTGCSTSAPTTDTEIYVAAGTGTSESVSESGCSGSLASTYRVTLDGDQGDEDYTGNTATATNTIGAAQFSFTPTVAGTYVLTVWNDADEGGDIDIGEAVQSISIVVAEATAWSAGLSTSIRDYADDGFNAAADVEIRVSSAAGTDAASIMLDLKDTAGNAKGGMRISAEVSGPGLVDVVTGATNYADATVRADALTLAAGVSTAKVHVTADGTAGTGTITIKVHDPVTLAVLGTYTETVYFYGTVATLEATANFTVARASATERGCSNATTCTGLTFATTPFVLISAKDAGGNLVPGLTVAASIASPAVVQASTVTAVTSDGSALTAGDTTDANGRGYYNASVAGATTAASGASTTITYYTVLANGTVISASPVTITIGGSAATGTETLSLDKASYEAGEGMTVTLTAKDSAGNPVYDGYSSPAVSFNKAIGGTAMGGSYYVGGTVSSDDALGRKTIYAPTAPGAFTATATAASLATLTATATIGDDAATTAAAAAADAAAEAIDAANAATDAANLAAEAADAATVAAEEARDAADAATAAVEELNAEITNLANGIKAQLATLASTVAKIAKKVKK